MEYILNLREVTYALSGALDLVGIDDTLHGKRVAYMAAEMAKELSWDKSLIDDIIYIGMLHDCGVSSTDVHTHLVTELDWNNSQVHSLRGEQLLKMARVYEEYAPYIRYHHTHWDQLPNELDQNIKNISNLIYLVDRVDALNAQLQNQSLEAKNSIQETIAKYRDTMFSPELVDTFTNISSKNSFWFYFEEDALEEYLIEWIEKGNEESFSFETVKEIALMFAAVVDAKSEFTSEHSIGVSSLSKYLAELFEMGQDTCEKIELAGLLHDLGKLRVEDAILNKPAKLNTEEKLKMNRHGFDSFIILRHIKGFKEIAHLASLHHETLDSQGYPYNLTASDIPFEARIITVADIFQALIQDRPYRHGLNMHQAYDILKEMCEEGKLDFSVVKKIHENLEECYNKASVQYEVVNSK